MYIQEKKRIRYKPERIDLLLELFLSRILVLVLRKLNSKKKTFFYLPSKYIFYNISMQSKYIL